MPEDSGNLDYHNGQLFKDVDKEYAEKRFEFEDQKNKREMYDRVREIIRVGSSKSDDSVDLKRGGSNDGNTIHVTEADLIYGQLIKSGEDAVVKKTDWIPAGERQINGRSVNLSILLESHDFTRFGEDGPQTRFGPVQLHARTSDKDGIEVQFPIVSFSVEEGGKAHVAYAGRHEMKYESPDYIEMQELIALVEGNLGINQAVEQIPPTDSPPESV